MLKCDVMYKIVAVGKGIIWPSKIEDKAPRGLAKPADAVQELLTQFGYTLCYTKEDALRVKGEETNKALNYILDNRVKILSLINKGEVEGVDRYFEDPITNQVSDCPMVLKGSGQLISSESIQDMIATVNGAPRGSQVLSDPYSRGTLGVWFSPALDDIKTFVDALINVKNGTK